MSRRNIAIGTVSTTSPKLMQLIKINKLVCNHWCVSRTTFWLCFFFLLSWHLPIFFIDRFWKLVSFILPDLMRVLPYLKFNRTMIWRSWCFCLHPQDILLAICIVIFIFHRKIIDKNATTSVDLHIRCRHFIENVRSLQTPTLSLSLCLISRLAARTYNFM